jgi:hypothetical protein
LRSRHVEHPENTGTQNAAKFLAAAGDVVAGNDAGLLQLAQGPIYGLSGDGRENCSGSLRSCRCRYAGAHAAVNLMAPVSDLYAGGSG